MRTSELGWSGLFVSSVVIGGCTADVIVSSGGSSGTWTCSVGVSWLTPRKILGYSITGSCSASSVAWNSRGGSCGALFLLISSASLSTPVILISPIGQPLRSVKINLYGSFQAIFLKRSMTV